MSATIQSNISLQNLPLTSHDFILRGLSVQDLLSYSRVNRAAHSTVQDFHLRAFRIENVLIRYFTAEQIIGFRRMQSSTGCLISGSTALSFFTREIYDGSDLDLYVEGKFCKEVVGYIQSVGYVYQPYRTALKHQAESVDETINQMLEKMLDSDDEGDFDDPTFEGYPLSGIVDVFNFVKGERTIQVIAAYSSPLDVILSFHSTVVMNIITHAMAVSFYPRATFIDKISLRNYSGGSNHTPAIEKYSKRGWKVVGSVDAIAALDDDSAFSSTIRNLGDRHCWTVYCETERDPELQNLHFYQQSQTWRLTFNNTADARMEYDTLDWENLKRGYCVARDLLDALPRHSEITWEGARPDDMIQDYLLELLAHERDSVLLTKTCRRQKQIQSLLLSAFRDARTKYPHLSTDRLPTAFAAQILMEHLELVFQTYRTPPKVAFTFKQNVQGHLWTNVKLHFHSLIGSLRGSHRVQNPVRPIASDLKYLRNFRISLEVGSPVNY